MISLGISYFSLARDLFRFVFAHLVVRMWTTGYDMLFMAESSIFIDVYGSSDRICDCIEHQVYVFSGPCLSGLLRGVL